MRSQLVSPTRFLTDGIVRALSQPDESREDCITHSIIRTRSRMRATLYYEI